MRFPCVVLFVVNLLALVPGQGPAGTPHELDDDMGSKCRHGKWDAATKRCECFSGWATAGITDTIDFLEGVCEQYRCQSDEVCRKLLNIDGASCPVTGWNCYCGWEWAYYNHLHGYETEVLADGEGGAECMGFMYTFSLFYSQAIKSVLLSAWMPVLAIAFLCVPFGKKRAICDHHSPTMWNACRKVSGCSSVCNGTCISSGQYTIDSLKDDFAWSIYVLDLGVWFYIFMAACLCLVLTVWSAILWALVILILVAVSFMGLCALCSEGGGDCNCCDCCGGAGGAGDCGTATGGGGECCSMECCMPSGGATQADAFFWGGSFPYDPYWGYGGYGHIEPPSGNAGSGCCLVFCRGICFPIAGLLYVFPAMPENAWGGLLGRIMRTHHFTPAEQLYTGNNSVVEFLRMGWRRSADLHADESWRMRVFTFLQGTGDADTRVTHAVPTQVHGVPLSQRAPAIRRDPARASSWGNQGQAGAYHAVQPDMQVVQVGSHARAVITDQPFDLARDRCYQSSFEDYTRNKCWICQDSNEQWDLWMSCRHLFCSACSTQMLERRMPCALCRVASSTVLRGVAADDRS